MCMILGDLKMTCLLTGNQIKIYQVSLKNHNIIISHKHYPYSNEIQLEEEFRQVDVHLKKFSLNLISKQSLVQKTCVSSSNFLSSCFWSLNIHFV